MSNYHNNIFDKIQQNTNIDSADVHKIAESVKHADFTDERMVRSLVQHLARLANKPISKQKEDKIVESITNSNMPMDMQSLNRAFKK